MGELLFSSKEDIEEWESVDKGAVNPDKADYNDFEKEFIDTDDIQEGDFWVGEYTGMYQFENASNPSVLFDNEEEELTYAFPNHVQLKTQVADSELEDHQERAEDPIEVGEEVAIVYEGTQEMDNRPMPMHVWDIKRPPQ